MIVKYEGIPRSTMIHEPTGIFLLIDAPLENIGKGELASPINLCATALDPNTTPNTGVQIEKLSFDLTMMRVEVQKERPKFTPRRIIKLNTEISLPFKQDDKANHIVELAVNACPVHHSLSSEIKPSICFHWH